MYVRVDEALIALAFCAKQTHSEPLRTLAHSEAITMINNQSDFLLFVHYCMKLAEILRGGQKHFGHGMCRVVEQWYEKFSPIDLANMFGEHRGLHGLTHQSVIKRAHMRTKKRSAADNATATAAAAAAPSDSNAEANANDGTIAVDSEMMDVNAGPSTSAATSTSNTPPATVTATATATVGTAQSSSTPTALTTEDDREQVFQLIFCNGSLEYLQYLDGKAELGPGAERLKALQKFKTNENIDDAVKAIQQHQFTIDQMPAHLLEQQKIWDVLLPKLSTRALLHHFHTMKDRGFLNDDSAFVRKFLNVFGKPESKFKAENICPIHVYIQKVLYAQNMRYLCMKKAEYYKKKMQKRKVTTNSEILNRLDEMFEQTLRMATPVSAKFFVVMDVRRGNAKSK